MKLFNKLRNKYFTTILSLLLLVMAGIGIFNITNRPTSVDASMIKFNKEKTISISNGSFNSFSSSSSYPYSLNNFTVSGNSTPDMKTGAINISTSEYAKNYTKYGLGEYQNPKGVGSDNYILMINTSTTSNYTYTSNEFTLPANGHYYITVSARTIDGVASIFLTKGNQVFENCVINNITSTTWSNYTFFVSTNAHESINLKVGMQIGNRGTLGASGCVLFDELHAGQISAETLDNCVSTFDKNSFKQVDYRNQNSYKEYNFDNKILEYNRNNKGELILDANNKPTTTVTDGNYFSDVTSGAGEKNFDITNKVLTLTTNNSYLTYKGIEETLLPNNIYRFSIWAKASNLSSGSANISVEEIIDANDDYDDPMDDEANEITAKSSKLTISSVTTNAVTDGYNEYVIYVNTNTDMSRLNSIKVKFSFGLGDNSTNATGSVSFKSYSIKRVPYGTYSTASTGDTVAKVNLAERFSLASTEFDNFTFDKMETNSYDGIAYPAVPTSWIESASGNGYQLSGIVNLAEFDKVTNKYSSQLNPLTAPASLGSANNNVLMIYNGASSSQSYTSNSKTLSANKFYKITIFVNTALWDNTSNGVTILAKNGDVVLGQVSNIKTNNTWQRVVMYINPSSQGDVALYDSIDLTLQLALGYGNDLSSGCAFFDNILVEEADTEGDFSNRFSQYVLANNGETTIDLSNPMLTSTSGRDYDTPILYTGKNKGDTSISVGIVDLTSDLKVIAEGKREALRNLPGDSTKVLAIVTPSEQDSYYEYTSLVSYNFESGKYYKLSFDLFTDRIGQQDKENKLDNGVLAEGVNISLTNLENAKFSYIQSNGQWTRYEIYVGINSTTKSNLVFGLGSEFTGCYGSAFLGNIKLETVEQSDFNSSTASANLLKVDTVATTEEEEPEEEDTNKSNNNFSLIYTSTILTFAAIIITVIAVFVRRNVKFKKRTKNKKADYDRDITVMQNKYRRLASDARDKEVRELTKECNELIALRNTYEEKYKDALARLRTARLANRDGSKRHEIVAIEHEVKHISKDVARFGVQVNNYENEIEFMQTEAYLIDLEKRMMREDTYSRNVRRKELAMTEEDREKAVAKREAKQQRATERAQVKADKLQAKQAKLKADRERVQRELEQAKALDEKYIKEQELKRIQQEQEQLVKEKMKAERELQKLEQRKRAEASVEAEQTSQEVSEDKTEQSTETSDASEQVVDSKVEDTQVEVSSEQSVETKTENSTEQTTDNSVEAKVENLDESTTTPSEDNNQ